MKVEKKNESQVNDSKVIVLGFELNHTQTILVLTVSLIGIFINFHSLAQSIFLSLFQFFFSTLPQFLNEPEPYHPDYPIYNFVPILTNIITNVIFLIFSLYAFKKVFDQNDKESIKKQIIPKERTVNWLGLTISHGQSLFLFSLSFLGLILLLGNFINSLVYPGTDYGMFSELCWIPTGPNRATLPAISFFVSIAIFIIFLSLSVYSLYITKRKKSPNSTKPQKEAVKNRSLFTFIALFVVLILSAARLSCHFAILPGYLLPRSHYSLNIYQIIDLVITMIILSLSVAYLIPKYVLKRKTESRKDSENEMKDLNEFRLFRLKLTPERGLIILSLAFVFMINFSMTFLSYLSFLSRYSLITSISFLTRIIIYLILIILSFYPIRKLTKENRFEFIINEINSSNEFETNWLGYPLDKLKSIIVFSTSLALTVLFVIRLYSLNRMALNFLLDLDYSYTFMLFSLPLLAVLICSILAILLYSIIKTYPSIKSPEIIKNKD
jgi:hypothetical protein